MIHIGQLKKGYKLLKAAKKPLFLIGGGVNAAKANKELLELVECTKIPVVTTVMGKGAIPTDHPYYIGNSGMHDDMQQILQSVSAMYFFPSESVLMTGSPEI